MDLSKVKVGDEVYSILRGWGNVDKKLFKVTFKTGMQVEYCSDGRYFTSDLNPEITNWKKKKKKKRREWKPKSHFDGYTIWSDGKITSAWDKEWSSKTTKEGRIYATKKQAEYAYKSIKACQILNAYKAEFAPDWEADWDNPKQRKWYVYYDIELEKWDVRYWLCQQIPGSVCFPKEIAEQLCKDLNDEVVKL